MGNRPKESALMLGKERTGIIRRGRFNGAATWEYECGGCISGTPLDGH